MTEILSVLISYLRDVFLSPCGNDVKWISTSFAEVMHQKCFIVLTRERGRSFRKFGMDIEELSIIVYVGVQFRAEGTIGETYRDTGLLFHMVDKLKELLDRYHLKTLGFIDSWLEEERETEIWEDRFYVKPLRVRVWRQQA